MREFRLRHSGDVDPIEKITAACGAIEAAENIHQRGFAGAGRAHHRDKFAGLHREADPAQGVNLHLAQVVGLVNIFETDYGGGRGRFAGIERRARAIQPSVGQVLTRASHGGAWELYFGARWTPRAIGARNDGSGFPAVVARSAVPGSITARAAGRMILVFFVHAAQEIVKFGLLIGRQELANLFAP